MQFSLTSTLVNQLQGFLYWLAMLLAFHTSDPPFYRSTLCLSDDCDLLYVVYIDIVIGCCCCCDSPAALLLLSVVQVEEVCDRSRVVPQVLHCKLRRMALTVEQMLYGVWCHSTLWTDIWYATGDAGLVTVQKPTVTRTQLGESGTDWPRQQTFKRWDIGWWSSKDSVWYKIRFWFYDCHVVKHHAVGSAIVIILSSVCPSVWLWRCVLWCSGSL